MNPAITRQGKTYSGTYSTANGLLAVTRSWQIKPTRSAAWML